jgi:hypothetical protein
MHMTGSLDIMQLVGFLTGAVLYGLLLVLVGRTPARPDAHALATAVLGLAWNLGELAAYALRDSVLAAAVPWLHSASYSALGLLAAVVVHSAARVSDRLRRTAGLVVYSGTAVAGALHVLAAAAGGPLPSPAGLTALTAALAAAVVLIIVAARGRYGQRATLWLAALAVFAVSVLHLGQFHGAQESWPIELVGHHASMVLAFALLYQDFRFAFADLFLKQALTLLALVAVAGGAYGSVAGWATPVDGRVPPLAIGLLLTMWIGTALVFPLLRRAITGFVDRVVLERPDYGQLAADLAAALQRLDTVSTVLDHTCRVLKPALSASRVEWREGPAVARRDGSARLVAIHTAEEPRYVLAIGPLEGGRRLLSDDLAMLERTALDVARRIDALRLTGERYERMLREREMRSLASEAELRALRAQINPHFLFNALTTITYLIERAPLRARAAMMRLTTLLRAVLRPDGAFTTLGREKELLDCYLQIEHERFEERLQYTLDVPDALAELSIPALVVQPLVENAIKHGISGAAEGGQVRVSARLGTHLTIVVTNTGLPLGTPGTAPGFGVGLQNVERRLRHHYGDGARVTLGRNAEGATVAELRIPSEVLVDQQPRSLAREAMR